MDPRKTPWERKKSAVFGRFLTTVLVAVRPLVGRGDTLPWQHILTVHCARAEFGQGCLGYAIGEFCTPTTGTEA